MAFAMKVITQVAQQRKALEEAVSQALELASGKADGAEVAVSKTTGISVSTRVGTGMGLRKEDNELREALNKAFAEMRADGTYEKLAKKYFDFDVYGG